MKKVLLLCAAFLAFSCSEQNEEVPTTKYATLTFEDADYTAQANYLGLSDWSSLIDDVEYGGELLYNFDSEGNAASQYCWSDEGNTELASEIGDIYGAALWSGGIVVSNYYAAVSEEAQIGSEGQLSIPYIDSNKKSGYNGSDNFAIVHKGGALYFGDGKARQIESMMVTPTSYWQSIAQYGDPNDETVKAMGSEDWFKITATSYDAEGNEIASTDFYLAQDGETAEGWSQWDLTALGEVTKVEFTAEGSVCNKYGSALPGYFALDNIVVRL